jgi:transcriptional regulator with XRE-family HTH domain
MHRPLVSPIQQMDTRPHPFPPKLSFDQAEEVRRLRAQGVPLLEIAGRFGIARSSVSAIVHLKAHEPEGTLRIALPEFERALLAEIAEDEEVPIEQLAAKLLVEMLRSRAW